VHLATVHILTQQNSDNSVLKISLQS